MSTSIASDADATARRHFLAIVRPENLQHLIDRGLSFYAIKRQRSTLQPGDRILLYRCGGKNAGVVGLFEVTATPTTSRQNADGFSMLYPTRIPWATLLEAVSRPMSLLPLVPTLRMFPNKRNYGASLQAAIKCIDASDFEQIERALVAHIAQ